ncbi:MAG: hypothetical protein MJ097_03100 [Dorea sp.]|nr:hypothetical protein [Dorea sp.]
MKKTKRILAIIAIIILVGMYLATLVFAILDPSEGMWMFKASIGCTIILPVLIYAYTLVYKVTRPDPKDEDEEK